MNAARRLGRLIEKCQGAGEIEIGILANQRCNARRRLGNQNQTSAGGDELQTSRMLAVVVPISDR